MGSLTNAETRFSGTIRQKDLMLRQLLAASKLPELFDAREWLAYLTGIKSVLGNLNNDLGFVATVLAKDYLEKRFGVTDFDVGQKAQGAPGLDICVRGENGCTIEAELKTTKPYQPGFGAAQRTSILKDLRRLSASTAQHRLMFVVDSEAFATLCRPSFAKVTPGVEVVDLVSGTTFVYGQER